MSQQIEVKMTDEMLKGAYANMAQIGHTGEEFVIDFISVFGEAGNMVVARVIVSPAHFKRLISSMSDNLKKFEDDHGVVKDQ